MSISDPQKGKEISPAGFRLALNQRANNRRWQGLRVGMVVLGLALMIVVSAMARAQQQNPPPTQTPPPGQTQTSTPPPTTTTDESEGKTAGNYIVQQSIEFGGRDSMIGGNLNNYNTFENLQSGLRLFDYSLNMHAIDHRGIFFDDLSFTNFGYGGDPNDVSRLHVSKNKWYDFRVMFRRDKNYWNYDLLANPLNTAVTVGTNPTLAVVNSPLGLDLSRHMQDYDLMLLPQSRLRFRLGYSRNSNGGPASSTIEGYNEPLISQILLYRTSSYRMGVDYVGIPKTTLSFDEFLTYSKIDETEANSGSTYQLSNGVPINLGLVYTTASPWKSTCAITNATTTPPTVSSTCTAFDSFSEVQNPRSSFPMESFRFQSTYFKNFDMTGSVGYSSGTNSLSGFLYSVTGWSSIGSTTGGSTAAKRVSMNADWSGDYRITDKLHIVDEFAFLDWRIPSMWNNNDTTLFDVPTAAGQTGMLIPISTVTPATFATVCPSSVYQHNLTTSNGPLCPVHTSGSAADFTGEMDFQYLAQRMLTNTIELKYDFSRRVGVRVGYVYTDRTIADASATFDNGELYLPGGASGATAANDYLAARGDCAIPTGGTLPAACTLNANGSITEGSPTNLVPEAGTNTARNIYLIHESAGLLGFTARPTDTLRLSADLMFGYNDNAFTRISPRQLQSYKIHGTYTPKPWAHFDGAVDIHENRDNVTYVNNLEHGRTYSFVATLSPNSSLWLDFGFNYMDIYTQTLICLADSGATAIVFSSACPVPGNTGGTLSTPSFYASKDWYAYGDVMWKPYKRVTLGLGYAGSVVSGNTTFVNVLQPTGTLDFHYLKPFASLSFDIYKGLTYKTAWNYYGYKDNGVPNPVGLALLPSQDFNGNNVTFSMRYAF